MKVFTKHTTISIAVMLTIILTAALFVSSAWGADKKEFSPRLIRPSATNSWYYSDFNPYYFHGLAPTFKANSDGSFVTGNCTWYAWGRAAEILGSEPQIGKGDPYNMWDTVVANGAYSTGDVPKEGSLVVGIAGGSPHVAVVEKIEDDKVYVSESSYGISTTVPSANTIAFHYGVQSEWFTSVRGYIYLQQGTNPINDQSDLSAAWQFKDVETELITSDYRVWYIDQGWLDYVVSSGIMLGYDDGSKNFGPYDPITRAQVATILFRSSNPDSEATTDPQSYEHESVFADVQGSQYYTAAINWCQKTKVVTGYEDTDFTEFCPDDPITREEAATMIARYVGLYGEIVEEADPAAFQSLSGSATVSTWAKESMTWCVANGIITGIVGNEGTDLAPQEYAWRASMAKIITVTLRDVLGK